MHTHSDRIFSMHSLSDAPSLSLVCLPCASSSSRLRFHSPRCSSSALSPRLGRTCMCPLYEIKQTAHSMQPFWFPLYPPALTLSPQSVSKALHKSFSPLLPALNPFCPSLHLHIQFILVYRTLSPPFLKARWSSECDKVSNVCSDVSRPFRLSNNTSNVMVLLSPPAWALFG